LKQQKQQTFPWSKALFLRLKPHWFGTPQGRVFTDAGDDKYIYFCFCFFAV
jgi:hypothetical protein